jgi:anthranilate synthase component I
MKKVPQSHDGSFETIARRYQAGSASLLTATLIADLETPVSAFLKLSAHRNGNLFLLESVEGGASRGRYSMIGLDPDIIWRCSGARAEINVNALTDPHDFKPCSERPLQSLRLLLQASAIEMTADLPPMAAGVFGYLGYDMVREMERLGPAKSDPIGVPDAIMVRPTIMVVFDSIRDEIVLVTPIRPRDGVSARMAYESAGGRLEAAIAVLEGPLAHDAATKDPNLRISPPVSNTTPAEFFDMVERAKEYIRAGDIFQVVLS